MTKAANDWIEHVRIQRGKNPITEYGIMKAFNLA